VSGQPLSAWHGNPGAGGTGVETHAAMATEWPLVALEPASRAWLHERIAQRFAAMLQAGLLAEVRQLRARGDLHAALPAMRCVGYRQAWAALDNGRLEQLPATGVAATRQLAKRQLTWLRSMPERVRISADAVDALAQGIAALSAAARGTTR